MATGTSHQNENKRREKRTERAKLLGSGSSSTDETKHKVMNPREIIAKYRKAKDAISVTSYARNKLVERQEKLEKLSENTEELEGRSEEYASLANELVKKMEKRKWWHIC